MSRRTSLLVLGAAACCSLSTAAFGQLNPIAVSGFDRDIVVENTATPPFNTSAMLFDANNTWYERTLPGSTKGLPVGGTFTSVSDPSIRGQLAPYNTNNALYLSAATFTSGTLTFDVPAQIRYDQIAVFASSANGGGTGTLFITFADSSTSANINFNAQDWFNVTTNNALNNLGRVNLNTNAIDDASLGNPRIYQTVINLASLGLNNREIVSISFTKPAASAATAIFGVSGQRAITSATPIDATGWNRDIVVENSATPPYSSFAQSFDTFNNLSWYENGLPNTIKGLPQGGAFTSLSGTGIQGQLRPYNGPNALFLDVASPSGGLTLDPIAQRPYEFLVIFAASSNQGGTGTMEVFFTDSTSTGPMSFNAQDWFNVTTNNALNDLGRLNLNNDTADDSSAGNPRLYQTVVDLASLGFSTRAVSSITFTKPNIGGGAQNTIVMGLSGQPVPGVTGACTFANGTCGLLPQTNCLAAGGTYSGDGTMCPPVGACIAPNGDCSTRNAVNCAFIGGSYQGDFTTCPPLGACIATNGDCTQLNSFQCAFQGGTFLGGGQPCPPLGACCTSTGCFIRNSFQCDFMDGAFQGGGTICELTYAAFATGGAAFEDITTTGTQITTWTGTIDDGNASIPVGFTFPFYGSSFTTAFVGTNGLLTFGAGSSVFLNTCLPTAAVPNNGIYPLWDDYHLHASHTGRVFYETRTSPTRLIVQWDLVGHYNGGAIPIDQSTFQAVLFENGDIQFRYGVIAPVVACGGVAGTGATVGVENAAGTIATSYDNTQLGTGETALTATALSPCPTGCPADYNNSGTVDSSDFFAFLGDFFLGNADFNDSGATDSSDFFDFFGAFFNGC